MASLADTLRNAGDLYADTVTGAGETGAALLTGLGAQAAGGLGGLAMAGTQALANRVLPERRRTDPMERFNRVLDAAVERFTYQPRTDTGKRGVANVARTAEAIAEPIARHTVDVVGERFPALGAGLVGAATLLGPGKGAKVRVNPKVALGAAGGLGGALYSDDAEAGRLTGALARAEALKRLAERPAYRVTPEGDFRTVEAAGRAAVPPDPASLAVPGPNDLRSSLPKQSSIAAAAEDALRGGERYKRGVFDLYGREAPELIDLTGAGNYDQLVREVYKQLREETAKQFDTMHTKGGMRTRYHGGAGEYPSSEAMRADVARGNLNVFTGGAEHPALNQIDPRTGLNANEQFRAVHDYYGHAAPRSGFGPQGEERAYAAHSRMYSPIARAALGAETRGQNSIVNYGPLNAEFHLRRARGEPVEFAREFQYAPNRPFLLPPEMLDPNYGGVMSPGARSIITPQNPVESGRIFHWSNDPALKRTDPGRYGTGIPGRERARLDTTENPRRERSYFYDNPQAREAGLGPHQYVGESSRFYDVGADPEKLRTLSRAHNIERGPVNRGVLNEAQYLSDLERMIWERGYAGMRSPTRGAATAFDPIDVELVKALRGIR